MPNLATQASEIAATAKIRVDGGAEVLESGIAAGMAVTVVYLLEPIKIEQQESHRPVVAHGDFEGPLELCHEGGARQDACQIVVSDGVAQDSDHPSLNHQDNRQEEQWQEQDACGGQSDCPQSRIAEAGQGFDPVASTSTRSI